MMNDMKRNSSYKHAISLAISKGHDKVLDIGAGSGLLRWDLI